MFSTGFGLSEAGEFLPISASVAPGKTGNFKFNLNFQLVLVDRPLWGTSSASSEALLVSWIAISPSPACRAHPRFFATDSYAS